MTQGLGTVPKGGGLRTGRGDPDLLPRRSISYGSSYLYRPFLRHQRNQDGSDSQVVVRGGKGVNLNDDEVGFIRGKV